MQSTLALRSIAKKIVVVAVVVVVVVVVVVGRMKFSVTSTITLEKQLRLQACKGIKLSMAASRKTNCRGLHRVFVKAIKRFAG